MFNLRMHIINNIAKPAKISEFAPIIEVMPQMNI